MRHIVLSKQHAIVYCPDDRYIVSEVLTEVSAADLLLSSHLHINKHLFIFNEEKKHRESLNSSFYSLQHDLSWYIRSEVIGTYFRFRRPLD